MSPVKQECIFSRVWYRACGPARWVCASVGAADVYLCVQRGTGRALWVFSNIHPSRTHLWRGCRFSLSPETCHKKKKTNEIRLVKTRWRGEVYVISFCFPNIFPSKAQHKAEVGYLEHRTHTLYIFSWFHRPLGPSSRSNLIGVYGTL